MMLFYLGTHIPAWCERPEFTGVPLFLSVHRLRQKKKRWATRQRWALDSGGFTEIAMHGRWRTPAAQYAREAFVAMEFMGNMDWAAPQDWMCEPAMLAKTGLDVAAHQRLTVKSFIELRELNPLVPWAPVLQGWTCDDYLRCADLYDSAGVVLKDRVVGVGTMCKRQNTREAADILATLWTRTGAQLHGFGMRDDGIRLAAHVLHSADSMAWSKMARSRRLKLDGCSHPCCQNCPVWALKWRSDLLAAIAG